jgi:hypothetical protein
VVSVGRTSRQLVWDFRGKVAVVTEASAGLGRRIALDLASVGAVVVGVARREGRLQALVDEMRRHSPESCYRLCHCFVVLLRDGYPLNVLNQLKLVPEVCSIYCATANAVEVVVAETELGRGILGVIDGSTPVGVETEDDIIERRALLRSIGYKL